MNTGKDSKRVVMIGLDAMDPELFEKWTDDGTLPHLRRLRDNGAYGRMSSTADWLVGSPWVTFYTGMSPADHGLYHYLQWRPEKMAAERPTPDWMPLTPFWRVFPEEGPKTVVIDMPLTYAPEPFNGVEISGWATHDGLAPFATYPASEKQWIQNTLSESPIQHEQYGLLTVAETLRVRDEMIASTKSVTSLATALMNRDAWSLAMVGFAATHRGGHKLFDEHGIAGDVPTKHAGEIADALKNVYKSCDTAVGKLMEAAGESATVIVFSVHGMEPNYCRTEVLPVLLQRILEGGPLQNTEQVSFTKRLRNMIPERWRFHVKHNMPVWLQDRLTAYWRVGDMDWSKTRAFSLVADLQGYVRINLRGRESQGIVQPGEEFDKLCEEIDSGLRSFADVDTGESIVAEIKRCSELYPSGKAVGGLPDLIVRWNPAHAARHRVLRSPQYGDVPWPTPGRNPEGRSGNHRGQGVLLACGPNITPGIAIQNPDIIDLAPTIHSLYSLPKQPFFAGKPIAEICPNNRVNES